jgi:hypothetical protein
MATATLAIVGVGLMFGLRIAARHQKLVEFVTEAYPREKIREIFCELSWAQCAEDADEMKAKTSVNWRSWGEIVSIRFRDGGAEISSECAFPLQAIDYGKNRRNVQMLIDVLKKKRPDQPSPRTPLTRTTADR